MNDDYESAENIDFRGINESNLSVVVCQGARATNIDDAPNVLHCNGCVQ